MSAVAWLTAALVVLGVWNLALTFYMIGFVSAIRDAPARSA